MTVPVVSLGGDNLAIKGPENFEKVMETNVALQFLSRPVPGTKRVRIFQVQIDLDEEGVELEGHSNAQDDLMHPPPLMPKEN